MRYATRVTATVLMAATVFFLGACKSSGPMIEAPTAVPTVAPTPEPTPIAEQVVKPPVTGTIPSVEVTEELPEDLAKLNAQGYLEDAFFETDRYDLKPETRENLAANAAWLQKHPTISILVEGHCDERNTREYNLALGERRASSVRDYLVFLGIAPQRIQTISYGEEKPFAVGHSEDAWQLNRRAHFVIVAR
ncbi:MAG: peptidoglycan-associated lipoprotein Pal [Thermoanaerobaculales bacterium]